MESRKTISNLESDFFGYIEEHSANFEWQVKSFLEANPNEEIWKYIYEDEYSILQRISFVEVNEMNKNFFKSIEYILTFISQKTSSEEYHNFLNYESHQGFTAFHYSAFRGNVYLMDLIIKQGGNRAVKNKKGINAVHMASQGNQVGSLYYLIEMQKAFSAECTDDAGSTPLHWACYSGAENAVNYLLNYKVCIENPGNSSRSRHLSFSSKSNNSSNSNDYNLIDEHSFRDLNINQQDKGGYTALHLAVLSKNIRIVKKLLQYGADKNIKDNSDEKSSPVDLAIKNKSKDIIKLFEKNKKGCNLCRVRVPIVPIKKSYNNIIFFILAHLLSLILTLLVFLSFFCYDWKTYTLFSFKVYSAYGIFFISVFSIYTMLIFSSSKAKKGKRAEFFNEKIRSAIEKKENFDMSYFCPVCCVKRTTEIRHCFICKVCIEGFDHHCYWVNNCIGKRNYWMFFLFLFLCAGNIIFNIIVDAYTLCQIQKRDYVLLNIWTPFLMNSLEEMGRDKKATIICVSLGINITICSFFIIPLLLLIGLQFRNKIYNYYHRKDFRDPEEAVNRTFSSSVISSLVQDSSVVTKQ